MAKPQINKLQTRLLVQCMVDAKLHNLPSYADQLQTPDSYLRVMLASIATVLDRELKNLAKRTNKKIDNHHHGFPPDGSQ